MNEILIRGFYAREGVIYMADQISKFEFLKRAMENLRTKSEEREYHNLHSVYSGFNSAFRAYFQDDPVEFIKALAAEGKIEVIPAKGGVNIYWPGESPANGRVKSATDVLAKMGL